MINAANDSSLTANTRAKQLLEKMEDLVGTRELPGEDGVMDAGIQSHTISG